MSPYIKKTKPCPIPGCPKRWRTEDGLFAHLFRGHLKNHLITWILNHMER